MATHTAAALPTSKEALTKLDAQLTCAICLDRYTDPRSLPCAHSYCRDCIDHLPVELDNGRHLVRCPSCRKTTQLSERGAAALPVAFFINNLLDIDELLKKTSSSNGEHRTCHAHNNRPKFIYCDTCEELVCLKCVGESHSNHEYDRAEYLFTKHKKQIKACLQPVKKRIIEVEQTLARFDTREGEMREQGRAVQKEIDDTYQQLINELQESRRKLSQEAAADLQEKLQLHSMQRGNVEAVLVQLKSCCEFVEEELRSQLQYQIQAAKKQLVKRINDTHSEVKVSELQPAQEPNIVFTANKNTPSACRHIGDISSKQSFSCPGLFSVDLPSTIMYRKAKTMVLTAPISLSASRLCCQLTPAQGRDSKPVVCPVTGVGEGQFSVSIRPFTAGLHHLRVLVDGVDIYGSPFPVGVADYMKQNLVTFAKGLDGPTSVAVTDDGQHVVVTEWNGHCVTALSKDGKVIRRFGVRGTGCGKFNNPCSVAVSVDEQIFVADRSGMLQKFSLSFSYKTSVQLVGGLFAVASHCDSRKLFTINDSSHKIEVFDDDLAFSYSFGDKEVFKQPVDIAIDTKGMVFVADAHKGVVLKFTPEGKLLDTIGSKGEKPHQFACPIGICINSNDIMYVTDCNKHQVMMFTTEGEFLRSFGRLDNQLLQPFGVAVDRIGNLYVCDAKNELLVSRPMTDQTPVDVQQKLQPQASKDFQTNPDKDVYVIGEKVFELSGLNREILNWEEFGFKLNVPDRASIKSCKISVKAIISGQFEIPEGTGLVSVLYAISCSERLNKSVTIEIEHCVSLENYEDCQYLSFGIARCYQSTPPYTFEMVDDGIFSPHSKFGKIKRSFFSVFAIFKRLLCISDTPSPQSEAGAGQLEASPQEGLSGGESASAVIEVTLTEQEMSVSSGLEIMSARSIEEATLHTEVHSLGTRSPQNQYVAQIFLECRSTRNFSWKFAVVKDLKALNTFLIMLHCHWQKKSCFKFEFKGSCLKLQIPDKDDVNGWMICPEVYPCEIMQVDVDEFCYRESLPLPCCEVTLVAKAGEDTAEFLNHPVTVENIQPEKTVYIQCSLGSIASSHLSSVSVLQMAEAAGKFQKAPETTELLNMVADKARLKWRMLGIQLHIDQEKLESIESRNRDDLECYAKVFQIWKKAADPRAPYTWGTIINALKAPIVKEIELANELEKWLVQQKY